MLTPFDAGLTKLEGRFLRSTATLHSSGVTVTLPLSRKCALLKCHSSLEFFSHSFVWSIVADEEVHLQTISKEPACENPKLNYLKKIIIKYFRENPDSRGIVFVKTREMTVALMNWMQETDGLKELNPHNVVGSNAPSQKAGTFTRRAKTSHSVKRSDSARRVSVTKL